VWHCALCVVVVASYVCAYKTEEKKKVVFCFLIISTYSQQLKNNEANIQHTAQSESKASSLPSKSKFSQMGELIAFICFNFSPFFFRMHYQRGVGAVKAEGLSMFGSTQVLSCVVRLYQ
jgi:hypothetical protein